METYMRFVRWLDDEKKGDNKLAETDIDLYIISIITKSLSSSLRCMCIKYGKYKSTLVIYWKSSFLLIPDVFSWENVHIHHKQIQVSDSVWHLKLLQEASTCCNIPFTHLGF